ncbi:MAG: DUF1343 domain-containing protein, partial [Robiginitalea sp.]
MLLLTTIKNTVFVLLICLMSCGANKEKKAETGIPAVIKEDSSLAVAANRTDLYFPLLRGKEFALVANQTSVIFTPGREDRWVHLADSLLEAGMGLNKVFAPEHGFRGRVDAGEKVSDGRDPRTGL